MKLYLNYFIFFLILLVVSCNKKTNIISSRNDSVEKYLKLASIDTLPTETRKKYNHKAFSYIDLEKNDSTVRWYLFKVSDKFIDLNDSLGYYKSSNLHLDKSKKINDVLNLARFYRFRGSYHRRNTRFLDSSLYYYLRSEKLFLKTNDKIGLAKVYMYLAEVQYEYSDYLGAEYNYLKALKLLKRSDKNLYLINVLTGLGNVNHNLKNYTKALKYQKSYLKLINDKYNGKLYNYHFSFSLNNIGNTYRELKNYDSAIFYFKKANDVLKKTDFHSEMDPYICNNLAFCFLKKQDFSELPSLLFKAIFVFDSLKIKNESAISRIYLAEYYAKLKDTSTAIKYADKAVELAKESKSSYYYLYTLSNAGTIDKKKAPQYIAEYHRLNDSLLFQERKARNQYFKIQLETDEIAQEKEKAIKQKWIQTSIIASVLLIVILLFTIYKQRSQKKEFLLIQDQQKANEEIYQLMLQQKQKEEEAKQREKKRIALELHDNVMNKLASTRFNLFTLTQQTNAENADNAKQHIQTIKEIEDEIRSLTHELSREENTGENGFASILTEFISQQNQMHRTKYQLELDEKINWKAISSEIKMNFYRIIQEAIHNCNKYAQATLAQINLTQQKNQLSLTIQDNGIGFNVTEAKQGIGLHNMRQRIESINGTITIHSTPETGTEIKCTVTINN